MLVTGIAAHAKEIPNVEVVVAPPFTTLYSVGIALADSQIRLAAKDVGCEYVIIGHSERRKYFGETNETVNKKTFAALRNELTPIVCVGETIKEREEGKTFDVLEKQLRFGLAGLQLKDFENFAIAYEPVWAIGTGKNASLGQIEEAHHFVRNFVAKTLDAPTANKISILYGGSVKASNAGEIFELPNVNGVLVGGASLDAKGFVDIMAQAK